MYQSGFTKVKTSMDPRPTDRTGPCKVNSQIYRPWSSGNQRRLIIKGKPGSRRQYKPRIRGDWLLKTTQTVLPILPEESEFQFHLRHRANHHEASAVCLRQVALQRQRWRVYQPAYLAASRLVSPCILYLGDWPPLAGVWQGHDLSCRVVRTSAASELALGLMSWELLPLSWCRPAYNHLLGWPRLSFLLLEN